MADDDDLAQLERLVAEVRDAIRQDLRRSRWRIVLAYCGITFVFAAGLWSYRSTVEDLQDVQRQQAVTNCLALNGIKHDLGIPLDTCSPN